MNPKVLHLINSLGGGGAERQLSYLAPALAELDVDSHIAFVTAGPNISRLQNSGCSLYRIASKGNYNPRLFIEIRQLIKSLRPDIIQTWLPQMDIIGGLVAYRSDVPYILSERNTGEAYPDNVKARVRRWVGDRAAAIVANSKQGLDYWSFTQDAVIKETIPNGLPLSEIDAVDASGIDGGRSSGNRELLLYAGRFSSAKNADLVLQAFIEVLKRHENATAKMFGRGVLERSLHVTALKSGLGERVQIAGYTDNLWQWMRKADVFVSLGSHEGQPNTVLEAAAAGCPLVVSDIPAHREILDERSAGFINKPNVENTVAFILSVLDGGEDAARKATVARQVVENYTVDASALRYRDLYLDISTHSR